MPVVTRLAILHEPAGGDQPRHADALTDQPPGLLVRDDRVGQHVKDLVEQPGTVCLGLGPVDHPLRQFVTGSRVRAGECLVEQLDQLVEHFHVGLGQRRQQDRVAPVDVGALQRLVGRAAPDLGQHPPPPGRDAGQVQLVGAVSAQELQLVQLGLQHLGGRRGGAAAQPGQAGDPQIRVDVEQPVELPSPRRRQEPREAAVGLGPGGVAGRGYPAGQRIHGRADHPLCPQPVTGQLQQHTRRVVLQGSGEEELVEQLAFPAGTPAPAQPSQHLRPVLTAGAALPAAVGRQQIRCRLSIDRQGGGQAHKRGRRTARRVVGNPAQPRQRAQLDRGAEPVLVAVESGQPRQVVRGEREERDQVLGGDLIRPAAEPGELGVGQEPNRHEARYPRRSQPDKTTQRSPLGLPVRGSSTCSATNSNNRQPTEQIQEPLDFPGTHRESRCHTPKSRAFLPKGLQSA